MVGKPFYLENGMFFDDTPLISDKIVDNTYTGVNVPRSKISEEYHSVWTNKLDQPHRRFDDIRYEN